MTNVKTISRADVQARMADGRTVVLEALPPSQYEQEHLPGALNLPHDQVDDLAARLIPDKATPVIVYCANGPCANSGIAARRLAELGYSEVYNYELGKQDWVEAGLPTETGAPVA